MKYCAVNGYRFAGDIVQNQIIPRRWWCAHAVSLVELGVVVNSRCERGCGLVNLWMVDALVMVHAWESSWLIAIAVGGYLSLRVTYIGHSGYSNASVGLIGAGQSFSEPWMLYLCSGVTSVIGSEWCLVNPMLNSDWSFKRLCVDTLYDLAVKGEYCLVAGWYHHLTAVKLAQCLSAPRGIPLNVILKRWCLPTHYHLGSRARRGVIWLPWFWLSWEWSWARLTCSSYLPCFG